jgi:hypothetical protein
MSRGEAHHGMTDQTTPLYVICSPCRRVGKTLVSRLLTEFYVVNDRPVAAFDLADEGPQLADYLPGITTIADIGDTRGQMAFFDRLIADDVSARIIDLSHRVFKNFFTVVQEIRFFEEARHRSIEPVILFIIDPDPKSAKAYAVPRHQLSQASLLPVRNQIEAAAISYGDVSSKVQGQRYPHGTVHTYFQTLCSRQRSLHFHPFWLGHPYNYAVTSSTPA